MTGAKKACAATRHLNPDAFCLVCDHAWGATEEVCPDCGFDPVGDPDDAETHGLAQEVYRRLTGGGSGDQEVPHVG